MWIHVFPIWPPPSWISEWYRRMLPLTKTSYSRIGLLFEGFVSRNLHAFRKAYITFIRPFIKYASNVWSPHLLMHINSIERVQRHFTKRITELRDISYRECLSILYLDTLEYRRLSCDLTLYYTIFNNLTPWSPSEYFNASISPYSLNSVYHDFNIRKPMCWTNSFENDFFNRCVSAWYSLPSSLVKSKSVASFKYNLRCKMIYLHFWTMFCRIWIYFVFIMLINLYLWIHINGFNVKPCDYQRYIYRHITIVFKLLLFHVSWSFKYQIHISRRWS